MKRLTKSTSASGGGVRTGTLTLLLLVVAIVLAVVAVLALQTGRSNLSRADAFASNVEQFYKNDAAGQEMLADLDDLLVSGGELTVGDVRDVVPEAFEVTATSVRGAYVNGEAVAYDSIHTTSLTYDEGIASDGLSDVDAESDPALLVVVQISTEGYRVREWTHVRSYRDETATEDTSLYTGDGSELQGEGGTGETGDPAQNNDVAETTESLLTEGSEVGGNEGDATTTLGEADTGDTAEASSTPDVSDATGASDSDSATNETTQAGSTNPQETAGSEAI